MQKMRQSHIYSIGQWLKRIRQSPKSKGNPAYRIFIGMMAICICFTFAACTNKDAIGTTELSAPYSVVFNTVPFASGDKVWDEAELIETDQYGRTLYFYRCIPQFNAAPADYSSVFCDIYVLVVCQVIENELVYFYEDQCYLLIPSEEYSANDLLTIKNANDWNKTIDENRLISVPNSFQQERFADEEECKEAFRNTVSVDTKYKLAFDEISFEDGESLCVLREYYSVPADGKTKKEFFFGTSYVALFDEENTLIKYSSFEGNFGDFQEHIIAFKNQ